MINYWATPNMGKMHLMHLIEINSRSYTKINYPYYFYTQWHDPDDYKKRIEKTFVLRKGQSKVSTPIKTKTTFGQQSDKCYDERHPYLDLVHNSSIDNTKLHANTSEVGGELTEKYFGRVAERTPPDILMKGKDPVEVFFTDKYFAEQQKYFPVSPCHKYYETFLESYLKTETNTLHPCIHPYIDELIDVDILFDPFPIMGRHMLGAHPSRQITEVDDIERYVVEKYKKRKNIIPYKEDLVDCFASKLKRYSNKHALRRFGTERTTILYKINKQIIWNYLDVIVSQVRRIENYFFVNGLDPVYFNMDRDSYKETFGFEIDNLSRTETHPGDYPEREEYETIAKEYISMRHMKDMRRRGRIWEASKHISIRHGAIS